jgi:hypothetical protein
MKFSFEEIQELYLASLSDYLPSARRYTTKQLIAKIGKEKLDEIVEQVLNYLESSCSGELNRNEYLALIFQLLVCLGNYLHKIDVPVTITTITNNIHHIPFSVDQAFPGYAEAGFLRSIIQPDQIKSVERMVLVG